MPSQQSIRDTTMKTLIAAVLAATAGASFAAAPTAALNHDPATYRNLAQKAEADYKAAVAKCNSMSGHDKSVCTAEAKAARAHAEADALAKYNSTPAGRQKSLTRVAEADYAAAKARCEGKNAAEKDECLNNAKSARDTALADAKAQSQASASAVERCVQAGGNATTGCVVGKPSPVVANAAATGAEVADRTEIAAEKAAEKTRVAAHNAAETTKELANNAAEKTKQVASTAAQKTENAMEKAGEKTREATETARVAANDTAITSKVKADLATEPDLKSLSIHVKTENGVVMLSGFVDSKDEADRAIKVARSVEGVTSVKSAIKVK
ncbi:BON domain-containing protein [Massilia horti]|uniref:Osmotically-inducible protein Y n=2 Tax=Massilia horti TaxID=2562153 RepID=A0A4Y9T7E6_9BURK|nr:BON domain-containing protein [Massilia horti]